MYARAHEAGGYWIVACQKESRSNPAREACRHRMTAGGLSLTFCFLTKFLMQGRSAKEWGMALVQPDPRPRPKETRGSASNPLCWLVLGIRRAEGTEIGNNQLVRIRICANNALVAQPEFWYWNPFKLETFPVPGLPKLSQSLTLAIRISRWWLFPKAACRLSLVKREVCSPRKSYR